MAERDTILRRTVRYDGIFDFNDLYKLLNSYLWGGNYIVVEQNYQEKVVGKSKEMLIKWEPYKKISDYFKKILKIRWIITNLREVEVNKDEKKVTMSQGDIEIRFEGILEKDYEDRWEDRPVWKFLRGFYDRFIIRARVDDYEDQVATDVDELVAQVKSFLSLQGKEANL